MEDTKKKEGRKGNVKPSTVGSQKKNSLNNKKKSYQTVTLYVMSTMHVATIISSPVVINICFLLCVVID